MVTPEPPSMMGSKAEELVWSKVVVPAKVTVVPALTFDRSRELPEGTRIFCSLIDVQVATAGAT